MASLAIPVCASCLKRGAWRLGRAGSISPRRTPTRIHSFKPPASVGWCKRLFADSRSTQNHYRYRNLGQARDIRIVELKPADNFDDPLYLSLKPVPLEDHDRHSFEAVSYVWGAIRGNQEVFCDGGTIQVTPNCESLLRHLRLKTQTRRLWVDALCINQSSTSDKNHQVPLMGDIFESAERVIIWLGPERSSVANFFRRVKLFNPFISPQLYVMRRFGPWAGHEFRRLNFVSRIANWAWVHMRSAEDSRILGEIGESSWFTRVWTLQEQLLSSKAVIVIGYHECSWEAFANVWAWNMKSIKSLGGEESPVTLRLLTWIAFQSTTISQTKGGDRKMLNSHFDIYSGLIECARTHGATDPRDKVYAFLPLMQRIDSNTDPMPVRYDMSYPEVYEQFARYSIRLSGSLRYLETLPPLRYRSSLPSWVVDLQVPAKYPMRRWAHSQLDARATGDSKVDLQLLAHSKRGQLLLKGLTFSTIKRVSCMAPLEKKESPDFAEEIATWFWSWRDTIRKAVLEGQVVCPYSSFAEGFHEFFDGVMRFNPYLGGCTLFVTDSGHLGVSQFSVCEGDEVVLLAGCNLPTVLRATGPERHRFFAVAYVAGISHGEAWNPRDSRSHENLARFTLI